MHRYLGPNLRGIVTGTAFGIVASACSYGAAAAALGFFQKGADLRSVFAFLISSTNMNVAILILFWTLVGWKFAFAEFAGGIVIIAIVATGFSLLFKPEEVRALAAGVPTAPRPARVTECLLVAGALMGLLIGSIFGGIHEGSMALSDRFTLISNIVAIGAVVALAIVTRAGASSSRDAASHAH